MFPSLQSRRCCIGACVGTTAARPHVVDFQEVVYNSNCMGSGVAVLINEPTWLLMEVGRDSRALNVTEVTLSCRVCVNERQCCPRLPAHSSTLTVRSTPTARSRCSAVSPVIPAPDCFCHHACATCRLYRLYTIGALALALAIVHEARAFNCFGYTPKTCHAYLHILLLCMGYVYCIQ